LRAEECDSSMKCETLGLVFKSVTTAYDAESALVLSQSLPPDIVTTDVMLPGIGVSSGQSTGQQTRQRRFSLLKQIHPLNAQRSVKCQNDLGSFPFGVLLVASLLNAQIKQLSEQLCELQASLAEPGITDGERRVIEYQIRVTTGAMLFAIETAQSLPSSDDATKVDD
jgi:CheY-like chemotaxis protein